VPDPGGTAGALLDVDGTLVDTNHLHALAWWRALRRLDRTYPMASIHRLIGMGGDKLVPELTGREIDGASDAWQEEFHRLLDEVTLLPGARELVRALHDAGLVVVLASSAPEDDVERFRQLLDVEEWLAGATSSDDADASKPDADIFEVAMDRFGLDPAQTVAIGDTTWDAKAAARAGIAFVGVETGGTDRQPLVDEGALAVHPDAADLAEAVADRGRAYFAR
jgi:HAD superfamily hydrolase (TIGR01509 family)